MSKITDYSSINSLDSAAVFLLNNGTAGTKIIPGNKLAQALAEISDDVQLHRNTWGGRSLGTSVSAAQWAQIQARTYHGMLVGDYWTIGGVKWVIADFEYWYGCGDTECTTPHVVIVPEDCLYNAKMNDSNIVTGAYVGSKMYTENLATAISTIETAFGSAHILSHREYFANAVTDHRETGHAWVDNKVQIMNESMVYGGEKFHNQMQGTGWAEYHTIDKTQLALFRLDPTKIVARMSGGRVSWWLRDVVYSAAFAYVIGFGIASGNGAGDSRGVRPAFGICAA
ncbi:MAG: hypothetical protein IJI23_00160 [Lachnospiraceae bacterium]|nr:hypothetical protein [Lachnospiraceae bacterium]